MERPNNSENPPLPEPSEENGTATQPLSREDSGNGGLLLEGDVPTVPSSPVEDKWSLPSIADSGRGAIVLDAEELAAQNADDQPGTQPEANNAEKSSTPSLEPTKEL